MSSWCSFRCPCLDELGVQVRSQYPVPFFLVAKCVHSMLFALWGSWMIDFGLEVSLVLWVALCSTFAFVELQWRIIGTCMVLTHDAQNFRWIQCCWFQVSLDSIFFFQNAGFWPLPGQNVFLVFIQVSVPRWVGVQVRSQYPVPFLLLQNVCIPCYSDCEAHGWLSLFWRLLWCCDWLCVQHLHLLNFSEESLVHLWCWLTMRKIFAGFNVADFRSRWIQHFSFPKCRLLASSGAKCLPGVHSGVRA